MAILADQQLNPKWILPKASWWIILVLLWVAQLAVAQTHEIDSLLRVSKNSTGVKKVDVLNRLTYVWWLKNYDSCKYFATAALNLSKQLQYAAGSAEASIYLGIYEAEITGDKESSMRFFRSALREAKANANKGLEGFASTQLGNLYRNYGLYDSALFYYKEALAQLDGNEQPWFLSMAYRNLSKYCGLIFQPNQELEYLNKCWELRKNLPDKAMQVDALVQLAAWHSKQFDFVKAQEYLTIAQPLLPYVGKSWVASDYQSQNALILFQLGQYGEALTWFSKAKDYYSNNSAPSYVQLLLNIGEVLEEASNYDASMKNYFEALKLSQEKGFRTEIIKAQLGIGRNYYRLKQSSRALEYAQQAVSLAQRDNFKAEEATAYNLSGLILKADKKYSRAREEFQKSLKIRRAIHDKKGEGATLGNLGEVLEAEGLLSEALNYQLKSLAIKDSILHQSGIAWAYFDLGSVYSKLKEFKKADEYLNKAEKLSRQIKSGIVLVNTLRVQRDLLRVRGKLAEALTLTTQYEKLKDSVNAASIDNRILSMQSLYELDKKNQEIELLKQTRQVQQDQISLQLSQLRQQRLTLISVFVGVIFLAALAFTLFKYYRKVSRLNRVIQERSEEIQTQSEELTRANSALNSTVKELAEKNEEIQAQSEELTEANASLSTINRELHENQEELAVQSEELSEANSSLSLLNRELAEKQEEMEAQSEELRESNSVISQLNEGLEQKVKDRTLKLQQAFKELDTFFYRSSHDFRRPLTTFMGLAEVAKITVKDNYALELFTKVKETAVNLDRMLIKLQSISDVGAEQFVYKEISIQTIFSTACDSFKELIDQKKIKITTEIGIIQNFQSYPAFLKIIVDNLLENSIHFCASKNPFVTLRAKAEGERVVLIVEDNGMGIEDEYKNRLFEMFFRGNESSKGNGLGLYIVKRAVDKLNGLISFESVYTAGTTVTIWLPLQPVESGRN